MCTWLSSPSALTTVFSLLRKVFALAILYALTNPFHSLKLKRPQTAKAFRADIDRMYAEVAATTEPAKMKL